MGTEQSQDPLVFETLESPTWMSSAYLSDDGDYVLVSISESTDPVNKLYIAKRTDDWLAKGLQFVKVVDNFDAAYDYITNDGPIFYFKTNLNAPKYKIVSLDFSKAGDSEAVGFFSSFKAFSFICGLSLEILKQKILLLLSGL